MKVRPLIYCAPALNRKASYHSIIVPIIAAGTIILGGLDIERVVKDCLKYFTS
ncbi:MAG: hypothetical protein QW250_02480 [Sulfolobaceae archaeon]